MNLFKSKLAKLEAFVDAKEGDRTPAMLAAAQEELDRASAGLMLVPKTESLKDGAALDKHLESLQAAATKAQEEAKQAKAEAEKATKDLEDLKTKRVVDGAAGSDKGEGGDEMSDAEKAEAARMAAVHCADAPWNAEADAMGFTVTTTHTTTETTKA